MDLYPAVCVIGMALFFLVLALGTCVVRGMTNKEKADVGVVIK